MVVVALIASITGMGVWTISGSLRNQQINDLSRGVLFAMMRGRSDAVADGFQRRLSCTSSVCTLQVGNTAGMAAPGAWTNAGYQIYGSTQAEVYAIDAATDVGTTSPAGPLAGSKTVTFFPDGSATPATVFLRDARGAQRFKVFVYSATGMARIVDQW